MDTVPPVESSPFRCIRCGYDLSGTPVGGACPECGELVQNTLLAGRSSARLPEVPSAMLCLVVGIISLVVCGLLGPVAIVWYYRAKSEFATGQYNASSMSMAKAGLVLGIIATALLVLGGAMLLLV